MNAIGQRFNFEFLCSIHVRFYFSLPKWLVCSTKHGFCNLYQYSATLSWLILFSTLWIDKNLVEMKWGQCKCQPEFSHYQCLIIAWNTSLPIFHIVTRLTYSLYTWRIFKYFYKFDDFKQALISSTAVDLGITGGIWQKSPASRIIVSPKCLDYCANFSMFDRVPPMLVCSPSYFVNRMA